VGCCYLHFDITGCWWKMDEAKEEIITIERGKESPQLS